MTKYSTGGGGGPSDGDACELCGTASSRLRQANVAGAVLLVCPDCAPHDDSQKRGGGGSRGSQDGSGSGGQSGSSTGGSTSETTDRKKRAARQQAKIYDAGKGDSSHWEQEGTNYERDRLPYLVSGYGEALANARQEAGQTVAELAASIDVDEETIAAVEEGRATRADVGGSVIRALEDALDVELVDE